MAASQADAARSERLKVFVSYSRTDLDFADQLVLALEDKGFEALVDRHDIDAAERWKDRLGALIASSDTVVFVLSEKSAGAPICQWEVEEAARLKKRIIPVVPQDPAGVPPPPQLGELNYIHFFKHPNVPGSGFYDGVQKLDRALRVNLGWLRRQTAYAEQATLWAADKSDDRVLGGKPLEEALQWRAETPRDAVVSPLVLEYLNASEACHARRKAEADAYIAEREAALKRARRAYTYSLIGLGLLVVVGTGTAWLWGRLQETNADLQDLMQEAADYNAIAERRRQIQEAREDLAHRIENAARQDPEVRRALQDAANAVWLEEDRRLAFIERRPATYPPLLVPGLAQSDSLARALWVETLDREILVLQAVNNAVERRIASMRIENAPAPVCDPVMGAHC